MLLITGTLLWNSGNKVRTVVKMTKICIFSKQVCSYSHSPPTRSTFFYISFHFWYNYNNKPCSWKRHFFRSASNLNRQIWIVFEAMNMWIQTIHWILLCICGLYQLFIHLFCHHNCIWTLHPSPSLSTGELTCSALHRLSLAVFMNTPGTYRLFLIKNIKRRGLPEPGSTCFRHFHNMCCRCVQRVFGGRRQHSCCLHNQFTSQRKNLPTVDKVNTGWSPFYQF